MTNHQGKTDRKHKDNETALQLQSCCMSHHIKVNAQERLTSKP